MSSTLQVSSAIVSAIIVATQADPAEAFIFNIEADEIALLVWTVVSYWYDWLALDVGMPLDEKETGISMGRRRPCSRNPR